MSEMSKDQTPVTGQSDPMPGGEILDGAGTSDADHNEPSAGPEAGEAADEAPDAAGTGS